MPYHVFSVRPFVAPELLAEFEVFADASRHAKSLRAAAEAPAKIRVMFAADREQAEDLLCQVRDPRPAGDE